MSKLVLAAARDAGGAEYASAAVRHPVPRNRTGHLSAAERPQRKDQILGTSLRRNILVCTTTRHFGRERTTGTLRAHCRDKGRRWHQEPIGPYLAVGTAAAVPELGSSRERVPVFCQPQLRSCQHQLGGCNTSVRNAMTEGTRCRVLWRCLPVPPPQCFAARRNWSAIGKPPSNASGQNHRGRRTHRAEQPLRIRS